MPHRPASHDWKGARYVWNAALDHRAQLALDVERLDTPPPEPPINDTLPHPDFLRAWTRHEVLAKLAGEPILSRLRREALAVPAFDTACEYRDVQGATFRLLTALWPERALVFTCGYRLA